MDVPVKINSKLLHRAAIALAAIAFILAVAPTSGCRKPEKVEPILKEFQGEVSFSPEQKTAILQTVRKVLSGEVSSESGFPKTDIRCAGVVLEVFPFDGKPGVSIVFGERFDEMLIEAIRQIKAGKDYEDHLRQALQWGSLLDKRGLTALDGSPISFADTEPGEPICFGPKVIKARIKIGAIDRLHKLSFDSTERPEKIARRLLSEVEPGVHGMILKRHGQMAFCRPETVIEEGWGLNRSADGNRERRVKPITLFRKQVGKLTGDLNADTRAWTEGELWTYTTKSFIEGWCLPNRIEDCYRSGVFPLRAAFQTSLQYSVRLNLQYLHKILREDGTLSYHYYPIEDSAGSEYYLPHHAGYVLRMIAGYRKFKTEIYLQDAQRALAFLREKIKEPVQIPGIAIVEDEGESLLGTNALMAMILATMPEEAAEKNDRDLMNRFGNAVLAFRMPQPGYFFETFEQVLKKEAPVRQPDYFPGVALLSLVTLYEKTGEKKWLDAAEEISAGLEALWEKDGPKAVGLYCWTAQAWARLARIEKDEEKREKYKRLAYSHGDAVIERQWTSGREGFYPDYLGGADNGRPPRTTPTSSRAESLAEICLTAKDFGENDALKKYSTALCQALEFVIRNQYKPENSWYLPNPKKAYGGIRGGLIAEDIRIDYNQHALGAMLNAMSIEEKRWERRTNIRPEQGD